MDETSTSLYRVTKSFVLFQLAYLGQQTALKRWRVQGIKNTFVTLHRKPGGQYFYCCQQEFPLVVCSFCSSGPTGCPPLYCTVQISVNDMDFDQLIVWFPKTSRMLNVRIYQGLIENVVSFYFWRQRRWVRRGCAFFFFAKEKHPHFFCSGLMNFIFFLWISQNDFHEFQRLSL